MKHKFDNLIIVKRSGQRVEFNKAKIALAIKNAFEDVYTNNYEDKAFKIYDEVLNYIFINYENRKTITVEDSQDIIEIILKKYNKVVYESFKQYREKRAISRKLFNEKEEHKFAKLIEEVGFTVESNKSKNVEGSLISFGKTVSREYAKSHLIENKITRAHNDLRICIKDIDYYSFGIVEASHLDFNESYRRISILTDRLIQLISNIKKEQYSSVSIPDIDLIYEKTMILSFKDKYINYIGNYLDILDIKDYINLDKVRKKIELSNDIYKIDLSEFIKSENVDRIFKLAFDNSLKEINIEIKDGLEKLFKINFEASINYNSSLYYEVLNIYDKSNKISKLIIKNIKDTKKIPLKTYVLNNTNNLEAFSNGIIIDEDVINNTSFSKGRMVLSGVSLDLARLGYKYSKADFKTKLNESLEYVKNALKERFDYQANKYRENYLYLFNDGLIYDSNKLEKGQKVRKVIKHGVMNVSLSGLLDCVCALNNKQLEDINDDDIKLSIDILKFIKKKVNEFNSNEKLNFVITEENDDNVINDFQSTNMVLFNKKTKINKKNKITDILNFNIEKNVEIFGEYQKYMGCVMEIKRKDISKVDNLRFYKVI